jgi:hypothetical protein
MNEKEETQVELALQNLANTAFTAIGSAGYSRAPWEVIDGLQDQLKDAKVNGNREDIYRAGRAVEIAVAWKDALVTAGLIPDGGDDHDWTAPSSTSD